VNKNQVDVGIKNVGRYVRVKYGPRGAPIVQSCDNKKFPARSIKAHRLSRYEYLAFMATVSVLQGLGLGAEL